MVRCAKMIHNTIAFPMIAITMITAKRKVQMICSYLQESSWRLLQMFSQLFWLKHISVTTDKVKDIIPKGTCSGFGMIYEKYHGIEHSERLVTLETCNQSNEETIFFLGNSFLEYWKWPGIIYGPINLIEVRSKDRSPTPFLWHRLVYNKGGLHSIGERKMIRCSSNELVEPLMIKLLIGVEPEEEERCAAVQNYICFFLSENYISQIFLSVFLWQFKFWFFTTLDARQHCHPSVHKYQTRSSKQILWYWNKGAMSMLSLLEMVWNTHNLPVIIDNMFAPCLSNAHG